MQRGRNYTSTDETKSHLHSRFEKMFDSYVSRYAAQHFRKNWECDNEREKSFEMSEKHSEETLIIYRVFTLRLNLFVVDVTELPFVALLFKSILHSVRQADIR